MICVSFREGSDNRLIVPLRTEDGRDVTDATVSVVIVDNEDDQQVDGVAWPQSMDLVTSLPPTGIVPDVQRPGSTYTVVFPAVMEIVRKKFYTVGITITATLGDSYVEQLIRCTVQ